MGVLPGGWLSRSQHSRPGGGRSAHWHSDFRPGPYCPGKTGITGPIGPGRVTRAIGAAFLWGPQVNFRRMTMTLSSRRSLRRDAMPATAASPAGCSASPPVRRARRDVRRRRPLLGTLGSLLAATAAAFAATVGGGVSAASASTHDWIATGWNINLADQLDPATTGHFFNTSGSFGTGPKTSVNPVIDGFAANAVLVYDSYAQFAADLQSGAISHAYKWVLYDPEEWPQTPTAEQLNPIKYLAQFGQLAHAHGYKVTAGGLDDLVPVRVGELAELRQVLDRVELLGRRGLRPFLGVVEHPLVGVADRAALQVGGELGIGVVHQHGIGGEPVDDRVDRCLGTGAERTGRVEEVPGGRGVELIGQVDVPAGGDPVVGAGRGR